MLRDCQELGIFGLCSKARVELRQFKGCVKKHKEQEQINPYQPPNDAEKRIRKLVNQQFMNKNPERRTIKEGGWEAFNLVRRNQLTWKK